MYESTIVVTADAEEISRLLEPEDKDLGRSQYSIKKQGKKAIITITAQDATAFKTVMNTLAKAFSVLEKTKALKNE